MKFEINPKLGYKKYKFTTDVYEFVESSEEKEFFVKQCDLVQLENSHYVVKYLLETDDGATYFRKENNMYFIYDGFENKKRENDVTFEVESKYKIGQYVWDTSSDRELIGKIEKIRLYECCPCEFRIDYLLALPSGEKYWTKDLEKYDSDECIVTDDKYIVADDEKSQVNESHFSINLFGWKINITRK